MKIISDLHELWCSLTSQELHKKATERLFWQFHNEGFHAEDMKTVVSYMQRQNAKGGRYKIAAHKVLGDLEIFASVLAMAKAENRNRRPLATERDKVIAAREKAAEPETADVRINGAGRHISELFKNNPTNQ